MNELVYSNYLKQVGKTALAYISISVFTMNISDQSQHEVELEISNDILKSGFIYKTSTLSMKTDQKTPDDDSVCAFLGEINCFLQTK